MMLTTRQRNLLGLLLGRRDFQAEEVAELDCRLLARMPGVGPKSVAIIRAWLAMQGLDLRNADKASFEAATSPRLTHRLECAVALLRRHGYRVEPPVACNAAGLTMRPVVRVARPAS